MLCLSTNVEKTIGKFNGLDIQFLPCYENHKNITCKSLDPTKEVLKNSEIDFYYSYKTFYMD